MCFVLLAFYPNLHFNMILPHVCYIYCLRLGGSSCNKPGPGFSKLGKDNPGLVQNLNSDLKA